MKCQRCGSEVRSVVTDMPFKISDRTIVILKDLPVLQCDNCGDFLLEDAVMAQVERLLGQADEGAELEVMRFAA
jgi:YgiT-type zinc finger domain-containing protein